MTYTSCVPRRLLPFHGNIIQGLPGFRRTASPRCLTYIFKVPMDAYKHENTLLSAGLLGNMEMQIHAAGISKSRRTKISQWLAGIKGYGMFESLSGVNTPSILHWIPAVWARQPCFELCNKDCPVFSSLAWQGYLYRSFAHE